MISATGTETQPDLYLRTSILEPPFGTAEFLDDMKEYPDSELFGFEQNEKFLSSY